MGEDLAFTADKYTCPLDHVPQFTDVAWPVVLPERFDRFGA
jgi:hypothetical protein